MVAALLVLGASGIVLQSSPLKRLRPSGAPPLWSEAAEQGSAPARLWQDPFQAVMPEFEKWRASRGTESEADAAATEPSVALTRVLSARVWAKREPWSIYVAFVTGNNFADSESDRIDDRFALLSGLGESGYVPEDRENVGFFVWNRSDRPGKPEFAVPYEWYQREHSMPDADGTSMPANVLVLWMRSDAVAPRHLLRDVADLTRRIVPDPSSPRFRERAEPWFSPDVALLTNGSNRLVDIASELCANSRSARDPPASPASAMRVLDWSATLTEGELLDRVAARFPSDYWSDDEVLKEPDARSRVNQRVIDSAKVNQVSIERMIGTDGDLLQLLARELSLRGISPGENGAHIALVHEWDTAYGRSIPPTFLRALSAEGNAAPNPFVHAYTFMKGVDGILPNGAREREAAVPTGKQQGAQWTEAPEGRNQLDYVRRLASRLDEERRTWSNGQLAAIGVFGDVFDKVPVLQALHEAFPGTILFTTDLEARLVFASADESLRNLLVASHYGLRLDSNIQRSTPPFRSVYQTALFAATLRALGRTDISDAIGLARGPRSSDPLDGLPRIARLYEVGRTGAHDLNSSISVASPALHPRTDPARPLGAWWLVGGSAAIFAGLALFLYARRVGRTEYDETPVVDQVGGHAVLWQWTVTTILAIATVFAPWLQGRSALRVAGESLIGRSIGMVPALLLLGTLVLFVRFVYLFARYRGDAADQSGGKPFAVRQPWLSIGVPLVSATAAALSLALFATSVSPLSLSAFVLLAIGGGAALGWIASPPATHDGALHSLPRWYIGASVLVPIVFVLSLVPRVWASTSAGKGLGETISQWLWAMTVNWSSLIAPLLAMAALASVTIAFRRPLPHEALLLGRWRQRSSDVLNDRTLVSAIERDEWAQLFRTRNWAILTTAIIAFIIASRGIELLQRAVDQEPVALWEGISAWPSIAIRCIIIVLGLWFLLLMREDSRANIQAVTRRWALTPLVLTRNVLVRRLRLWPPPTTVGWNSESVIAKAALADDGPSYGETLWPDYVLRGRTYGRTVRTLILTALVALLLSPFAPSIWAIATAASAPRGEWARWLHFASFLASGAVVVFVTLAVWDVSNLAQRFIVLLMIDLRKPDLPVTLRGNVWRNESLVEAHRRYGLRGAAADAYLTIRVIADRTRWVTATIYYPFILIVLMVFASASGFDAWPQSWQLFVAFSMPALIAVFAAQSLQSCARRARDRLLERLAREVGRSISVDSLASSQSDRDSLRMVPAAPASNPTTMTLTSDDVKLATTLGNAVRHGALAPYTDNPLLRALLLPFGGFGAIQIVNYAMAFV